MFSKKNKSESSKKIFKDKLICEIILLDPNEANIKINVNITENGNVLFNKVCDNLGGILEKDYFGLIFIDKHGQKQWLELSKSISKQVKEKSQKKPCQLFSFRFKHYPKNPYEDLKLDLTKYLLYLQLRQDLFHGRLAVPQNDEFRLAALIIQAEIGNFEVINGDLIKLAELYILPSINRITEKKIMSVNETFKDLDPCDAERLFLSEASKFEMYGVTPIGVKDQKGNDIYIGLTYGGISTYSSGKRMHTFLWPNIAKLSFSHKMFLFQVIIDKTKHILGFKCESSNVACFLWKWALDRKCFFTLDRASDAKKSKAGGSLFKRKKSYTFSGRSQQEISKSCQALDLQIKVTRSHSILTLLKPNKFKNDSENSDPLVNGFSDRFILTLPQEEQYSLCDSNENEIIIKSTNKEVKNKPSSAVIGNVLDFMQALKESPLLPRKFQQDCILQIDTRITDNYSQQSDKTDEDCDTDFLTEIVEIVDAQQKSLLLQNPTEMDEINICNPRTNDQNEPECLLNREEYSNISYVMISVALFGLSMLLGFIRIIYINLMQSSDKAPNDVKNVPLKEYFKNFFFK